MTTFKAVLSMQSGRWKLQQLASATLAIRSSIRCTRLCLRIELNASHSVLCQGVESRWDEPLWRIKQQLLCASKA